MRKILVMEDEDNIRAFVVLNLKRVGYDVVDVASGEAALEAFAQAGGDFDIAILDIMLPGIDGFEVCRQHPGAEQQHRHHHALGQEPGDGQGPGADAWRR